MKKYSSKIKIGIVLLAAFAIAISINTHVYATDLSGGTNPASLDLSGGTHPASIDLSGGTTGTSQSSANTGSGQTQTNTGSGQSASQTGSGQPAVQRQSATFTLNNPLGNNVTLTSIILTVMTAVTYLAVLLAVLMLIWTGLQYVLARGNADKIKEHSKTLGWIVVGLAIILGARIIISAVINTLDATKTVNPAIIQQAKKAQSAI